MRADEAILPEGWETSKLGDVATTQLGKTINPKEKHGLLQRPYLRNANVQWDSFNLSDVATMHFSDEEAREYELRPGDLLVCEGGIVGRGAIWAGQIDGCYFQNALHRITPRSTRVTNAWLLENIRWLVLNGTIAERSRGNTILHLSQRALRDLPILIPPTEAQENLTGLLVQARSARQRCDAQLDTAHKAGERLRQSILAAACSGVLTAEWRETEVPSEDAATLLNRIEAARRISLGHRWRAVAARPEDSWETPAAWVWTTPEQLLQPKRSITYGVIKLGKPVADGVPTLRSSDVRWLRIDGDQVKRIRKQIADDYQRTYLQGGEILVTVRGTLGGVAVVPPKMRGWNISREVAVLPLTPEVDAAYFVLAIASNRSQQWLSQVAKGVAYTGVNIEDLKKLPLPLPPIEEQQEIVRRVSSLLLTADALLRQIDDGSRALRRTSQAILAKAFRGELLPLQETTISA